MGTYDHRKARAEMKRKVAIGDPSVPHATHSGYANWGCRCKPCYHAWLKAKAQRFLDLT